MKTAPDLMNGTIYNGNTEDPSANVWATEIQSVLRIGTGGERKTLYLNHECRNEQVPFMGGMSQATPEIFMKDRPEEFLTYSDGEKFVQLECPPVVFPTTLGVPNNTTKPFLINHERPLKIATPSRVDCLERPISCFANGEAIEGLQNGAIPLRSLFLKVSWLYKEQSYEMIAPCRYVNFSPKTAPSAYLQPISGQVLIEMQGLLFPAYVACAWGQEGETKIEFAIPRYHSADKTLTENYGIRGAIGETLERVYTLLPAFSRKWDGILEVEGEFCLFQYE